MSGALGTVVQLRREFGHNLLAPELRRVSVLDWSTRWSTEDSLPSVWKFYNPDRYAGLEENLLNVAKRGADVDKLREILDKGNDPNIMVESGWTPPHAAAKEGYLEVAEVHTS